MIASGSAMRPPAPTPCSARKAASSYIVWAKPDATDPTRKIEMAMMKSGRRPKMSESLP
jgi:hypothetical protein